MIQEEKDLLIKDLSARLHYGVKVNHIIYNWGGVAINFNRKLESFAMEKDNGLCYDVPVEEVRPYLRPMSSMTEEERSELSRLTNDKFKFYLYTRKPEIICYEKYNYLEGLKVLDYLNAHHFDYRGLIEKGLALEAPDGMYKTE